MKEKLLKNKIFAAAGIAAVVVAGIVFWGMGGKNLMVPGETVPDGNYVAVNYLAESAKEKYKESEKWIYGDSIELESRSESFELDMTFDARAEKIEKWNEICELFQNPDLTNPVVPNCKWDEERGKIIISPMNYPIGQVSISGLTTEEINRYKHGAGMFFPNDVGQDWGNLGTLYLAVYRDLETGEILEKPIVHIVKISGEIKETPVVRFYVEEDGRAGFTWNEVEDAKEYIICKIPYREDGESALQGMHGKAEPIAMTEGTSWTEPAPEYNDVSINWKFLYYRVSEDDWNNELFAEMYKEQFGTESGVVRYEESDYEYCVIAINENGTSMMSNTISLKNIAENLPHKWAGSTARKYGAASRRSSTVEELPIYNYVTMCDGYTAEKLIDYKTENAIVRTERWGVFDDNGNVVGVESVQVLRVPYVIEGTPFEDEMFIEDYDESRLETDMLFLEEREDSVRKKAGDLTISSNMAFGLSEQEETAAEIKDISGIPVTANSALSEYLAKNMLAGVEVIDLTMFPEAASSRILDDAWREAYYQNPLILGMQGYRVNARGTKMWVVYDDTKVLESKQQELLNVIPQIVDSIITDNMSDLEKEFAINQYLCDNIEYDNEALENAEKNNFTKVDEEFNDSFTAYGALMKGKCVCAGYAAAFKLLSEEAGLNSIVVTGKLEGNLNHAWNKVQIDGNWYVLDVTNNDMEFLNNALLNLSNSVGDKVLIEDRDYVLDDVLSDYVAESEDNEFYHVNEKFYSYEEIVDKLVEGLSKDGKVLLRTEYEMNDEIFYAIAQSIYDRMGDDVKIRGSYWLGVIYLQDGK